MFHSVYKEIQSKIKAKNICDFFCFIFIYWTILVIELCVLCADGVVQWVHFVFQARRILLNTNGNIKSRKLAVFEHGSGEKETLGK